MGLVQATWTDQVLYRIRSDYNTCMSHFAPYIPIDRRFSLAENKGLPDRALGTALFADLSGFTHLTTSLVEKLGRKRGAEEVLPLLNKIFNNIVHSIHHFGGSVIHFSGDAVTCWFDGDNGHQAVTAAVEMQRDISAFETVELPGGLFASISMKVAVAQGSVRRFKVGSPEHSVSDVLAGRLVDIVALGERLSSKGEILIEAETCKNMQTVLKIGEWREGKDGLRFGVLSGLLQNAKPSPWPESPEVPDEIGVQFVHPSVAERLQGGQRHHLAEIRPSTALFVQFSGPDYDGDDASGDKLDRYVQWVQEVVDQFGGLLLQLTIGDKGAYFYLVFGSPVAHADDASRALASAMVLRKLPEELSYIKDVKIGIAQGQMRTGAYGGEGRLSYGVLGEKVNRAARLMSYAPPGEVYCDESIVVSAQDRWEFEPVLPGIGRSSGQETAPIRDAYRLTGERITRKEAAGPRSLVGRKQELTAVSEAVDAVVTGLKGLVWLVGEAGIGKSRLVQEVRGIAEEAGFLVLEGAGSSIDQQTAYWAWRSVLGHYFGWGEESPEDRRLALVQSTVSQLLDEHLARLPVLNDIAFLGIPENDLTRNLPTQLRVDNVVLLVAELLRGRSQKQPILVVFEDVHWMDDLSWQLSVRVAQLLSEMNERVAVIWSTRPLPAPAHSRIDSLRRLGGVLELELENMPSEDVGLLVSQDLNVPVGTLPAEIVDLVQSRAEGNPLYARELVRTLKERRLIWYLEAEAEASWQIAEDFHLATSTLPDTLQGLILARIDRLKLDQQTVLKVASVIGRTFSNDALSHAIKVYAEHAYSALNKHIEALTAAELLQVLGDSGYMFNHILTRDTTYQTLLFAQRRDLHQIVAGWYEMEYAGSRLEPYFPALAFHYRNAEEQDKEFIYVRLSADQAQKRYANREALEYISRALEITDKPEELFRLRLQREEILGLVGDRAKQSEELAQLSALCQTHHFDSWAADLAIRSAQFSRLTGNYADALSHAQRVIEIGERTRDDIIRARGAQIKGQIFVQQGRYDDAVNFFETALAAYRLQDSEVQIAEVYGDYGILEVYQGDFRRAVPYFERAIEIYRQIENRREAARNQMNLAGAYGYLREIGKAIENYSEAYEINREIGERRNAHIAQGNLGAAYLDCGDYGKALRHLNAALSTSRSVGDLRKEGTWLGNLGEVSLAVGWFNEAVDYLNEALKISTEIGNKNGQGMWLNRLGEANRLLEKTSNAKKWIARGLALNQEIGNQSEVAYSLNVEGMLFVDLAKWDQALEALERANVIRENLNLEVQKHNHIPGIAFVLWKQNQAAVAIRRLEDFWVAWQAYPEEQRAEIDLWSLWAAFNVYDEAGDPRGEEILITAYRLLQSRADQISDPEMQREFLSKVRVNQDIKKAFDRRQAIV